MGPWWNPLGALPAVCRLRPNCLSKLRRQDLYVALLLSHPSRKSPILALCSHCGLPEGGRPGGRSRWIGRHPASHSHQGGLPCVLSRSPREPLWSPLLRSPKFQMSPASVALKGRPGAHYSILKAGICDCCEPSLTAGARMCELWVGHRDPSLFYWGFIAGGHYLQCTIHSL